MIGLLSAYLPAYTDRIGFWTLDGDAIRWLGVMLFAAGGVLRIWPVFVLGRRFSGLVAIQPGHTLVTSGVYGIIRHPSYLGLLVRLAGVGPRLSFRGRRTANGAPYPATPRAHPRGRETATHAVRCRVRCLLPPHVTAHSRAVLRRVVGTGRTARRGKRGQNRSLTYSLKSCNLPRFADPGYWLANSSLYGADR